MFILLHSAVVIILFFAINYGLTKKNISCIVIAALANLVPIIYFSTKSGLTESDYELYVYAGIAIAYLGLGWIFAIHNKERDAFKASVVYADIIKEIKDLKQAQLNISISAKNNRSIDDEPFLEARNKLEYNDKQHRKLIMDVLANKRRVYNDYEFNYKFVFENIDDLDQENNIFDILWEIEQNFVNTKSRSNMLVFDDYATSSIVKPLVSDSGVYIFNIILWVIFWPNLTFMSYFNSKDWTEWFHNNVICFFDRVSDSNW
jgi:hypothetical protein